MTETLMTTSFETPVGPMHAFASDRGLCALEFCRPERDALLHARLRRWFTDATVGKGTSPYLADAKAWLDAYFSADFTSLPDVALDPRGTEFELSVWKQMLRLGPGKTMSYGELAKRLSNPNGSRAVGNASRRNPIALIIPCHRVVGSNGSLTGYGGGLNQKEWLLGHEATGSSEGQRKKQKLLV